MKTTVIITCSCVTHNANSTVIPQIQFIHVTFNMIQFLMIILFRFQDTTGLDITKIHAK